MLITGLAGLANVVSGAQTPPDLVSAFDAGTENWRADTGLAVLGWQTAGTNGFLTGRRPGSTNAWSFVAPASWSGDWSGYRVMKFDISIPSRHYPDADRAGLVTIAGANGQEMTWTASTPLWTWTHYEITLSPAAFGVDAQTFAGIMSNVLEARILAEYSVADETAGLDNVLVTAAPPQARGDALISRFTDGTIQEWRPVDDVTLTADPLGRPSSGLKADDWMDGRLYKIATPVAWAGDWSAFKELAFDMRWTGAAAAHTNVELVRIFGANGQTLSWSDALVGGVWTNRAISLSPDTFHVAPEAFQAVMAHVSEMWIFGEFGGSDDITYLDNVVLSPAPIVPAQFDRNLVSRFDADTEGWHVYDNGIMSWAATNGVSGGALQSIDNGYGLARFESPEDWSGDWTSFQTLRFSLRARVSARTGFNPVLQIVTWNGKELALTLPKAYGSWTPYTIDLKPETFGVSPAEYAAVMGDVACMWIQADLVSGTGAEDTTWLDNVMLLTQTGAGIPPDRWSSFDAGHENWRTGGWNTSPRDWSFNKFSTFTPEGGNPGGHIRNTDTSDWTYWFTPESWAGDWRGLQSVSFDFNIVSGSSLFETRMVSICSVVTNLHANVSELPVPRVWTRYEFPLTAAVFGVTPELFDLVMRDVAFLGIRSEWVNGSEIEALDNVRISKAPDAYWAWISGFLSGEQLANEDYGGKFADPDGDNSSNWVEYVAGTNPTNHLDSLKFEDARILGGNCVLGFKARTGRLYTVEAAPSLKPAPQWQIVAENLAANDLLLAVTNAADLKPRFYRLSVRMAD